MKSVVQEEKTGCAIASLVAISGTSHEEAREIANGMGIYTEDPALWSETKYIRRLLTKFQIQTGGREITFTDWKSLPDLALLSIKWHLEGGNP